MSGTVKCPACKGKGITYSKNDWYQMNPYHCGKCHGSGKLSNDNNMFFEMVHTGWERCCSCHGRGTTTRDCHTETCSSCKGLKKTKTYTRQRKT